MTGLDYFNARYYDPVSGQFLSADVVQGNAQGTSPYMYVMGNPESRTDPTGQRYTCNPSGGGCGSGGVSGGSGGGNNGGGSSGGGGSGCDGFGYNKYGEPCNPNPPVKPPHRGGSGSGGGGIGGCHSGGRDGASAGSCTGTESICDDSYCERMNESEAESAAAELRSYASDVQVWIDRLNGNDAWLWLGFLGSSLSTLAKAGGIWGFLLGIIGTVGFEWGLHDVLQILAMTRNMLDHIASDFDTEWKIGWTFTNVAKFGGKEEAYLHNQMSQIESVDWLGPLVPGLGFAIGGVRSVGLGYASFEEFLADGVIDGTIQLQEEGLWDNGDPMPDYHAIYY